MPDGRLAAELDGGAPVDDGRHQPVEDIALGGVGGESR
jgi:hypothetical protein